MRVSLDTRCTGGYDSATFLFITIKDDAVVDVEPWKLRRTECDGLLSEMSRRQRYLWSRLFDCCLFARRHVGQGVWGRLYHVEG